MVERPKIAPQPPLADHQGVGREGADLHRHQVLAHAAAAAARLVDHRAEKIPVLVLADVPGDFPAADLLVQGVDQLLAGRGPGEGRPLVERAAEAALVAKALGRAVEGHAQPVHEVDDLGGPVGQFLDRRLVLQEVAAVDGVVEVLPFAVAQLPRQVVDAVDAALGADAMRAFHRQEAHDAHVAFQLGQLDGGGHSGQSAADDHHRWFRHDDCSCVKLTVIEPEPVQGRQACPGQGQAEGGAKDRGPPLRRGPVHTPQVMPIVHRPLAKW